MKSETEKNLGIFYYYYSFFCYNPHYYSCLFRFVVVIAKAWFPFCQYCVLVSDYYLSLRFFLSFPFLLPSPHLDQPHLFISHHLFFPTYILSTTPYLILPPLLSPVHLTSLILTSHHLIFYSLPLHF